MDVLLVHITLREEVELLRELGGYRPFDEELGWDYDNVFMDRPSYREGEGKAHDGCGVSKEAGRCNRYKARCVHRAVD